MVLWNVYLKVQKTAYTFARLRSSVKNFKQTKYEYIAKIVAKSWKIVPHLIMILLYDLFQKSAQGGPKP